MLQLVDSHCHLDMLDLTAFDGKMENVLTNACANHVHHCLCVAVNLRDLPNMLRIADTFANVSASVGVHPNEQDDPHEVTVDELVELAQHPNVVAIGETGLDYFRQQGDLTWQQNRFRTHIQAAIALQKPVIIHTRNAREDTIAIMREQGIDRVGGVMHCFTETQEMAAQAIEMGCYISFSGIVTFKNATELQAVAKTIPLERLLIETDSPYLAPVPYRGKANQPAYVYHVADYIATLRGVSLELIAQKTTENYIRLFNDAIGGAQHEA